jgi:hypothetical protein
VVDCDASGSGFDVVLHQGARPLAFYSRAIAPHHAKLTAYERELIGLVKAVKHWRPYLWTRPFIMRTDHFSLKYLLDQCLSTIPQHSWVSKLFGFQFTVEFNPGRQNATADTLSRRGEDPAMVHALFRHDVESLPDIVAKKAKLTAGSAGPELALIDGMVVHRGRMFLPAGVAASAGARAQHGP